MVSNSIDKNFLVDSDEQRKLFKKVIDKGFDFVNGKIRGNKAINYKSIPELQEIVSNFDDTKSSLSKDQILEILDDVGNLSVSQSDLGYIAFPDSGNAVPAMMAEIYSKFLNQNLTGVDRSAPLATFMEIQLIEWLRGLIGYESKPFKDINSLSEVSGMCTTGGHMSNHIAIMSALNEKFPEVKQNGLTKLGKTPKIILADAISHYSFSSAMHHLGLGQENILKAKSTERFTTDIEDVKKIIKENNQNDEIFMIVAVAGNSRTSSIDSISELSKVCRDNNIWLHVDACHGGSLLFSQKLKEKYLSGIELADSVSIDPHKGMFVTYPLSYVLFKKRDILTHFTRYEEKVRSGDSWELGYITPFYGSRGFESFKLWLMIKSFGIEYLAEIVEEREKNAKMITEFLVQTKLFSLFNKMELYRLVFIFLPENIKSLWRGVDLKDTVKDNLKKCIDSYTHKLNQLLYEEGEVVLDEFKLPDISNSSNLNLTSEKFGVMSISIGNPLFNKEILENNVQHIEKCAKILEENYRKDILNILEGSNFIEDEEEVHYGPAGWN